ncbi:MAG: DUF6036 family nucleotidyltransferase [Vicinamibacterales bacterium]
MIRPGLTPTHGGTTSPRTPASAHSSAVPVQPAAAELLGALAPVLGRWGRWYLFGAQAVVIHGVPRMSADVDITLSLTPDAPERFAADMTSAGFSLRVDDPDFVRRTRVMPFVHTATGMPLDVVLASSGLEDEFLDRARAVEIGGTSVPVIDPTDLVIAKVLAGRNKDIDDAATLWRIHRGDLDAGRIVAVLRLLEEALGQSDLVSAFERIRT